MRMFQVIYDPTLDTWRSLIETGRWFAAVRTLRVAVTMTVLELLLAFPFALWLAKGCKSNYVKATIITLLTIPFFLDNSCASHYLARHPWYERDCQHNTHVAAHHFKADYVAPIFGI